MDGSAQKLKPPPHCPHGGARAQGGAMGDASARSPHGSNGASGSLLRTFVGPYAAAGDKLGTSVATLGTNVLVGTPYDDTQARDGGAVFLFDGATGTVLQTLLDPGMAASDFFGVSLATIGSSVVVGAIGTDLGARDAGAAYLLDPCACDSCQACAPILGCVPALATTCRRPVVPGKAALLLTNKNKGAAKRALSWKWSRGAATTTQELGDPRARTSYALCIYDQAGGALTEQLQATVPAGGSCRGKPCWRATGTKGFRFLDKQGTTLGIKKILLQAGEAGKARIAVKAKGPALGLPALPLSPPVSVQLKTPEGPCWEASYAAPRVNTASRFKARSD